MEDDDWTSVSRRQSLRTSVFQCLADQRDSKLDRKDVDKVNSTSQAIYIMNFPNHKNTGDLWRLCEKHWKVVDVFLANKKVKLGKNFGFVRFIKVSSLEGLVSLSLVYMDWELQIFCFNS